MIKMKEVFARLTSEIHRFEERAKAAQDEAAFCENAIESLKEEYISASIKCTKKALRDNRRVIARLRNDFAEVERIAYNARTNAEMAEMAGKKVVITAIDNDTITIEGCPYAFNAAYIDGATIEGLE